MEILEVTFKEAKKIKVFLERDLSEILEKIKKYHIINIDICVITEEPKLKPYAAKIEESLSSLLHIDRNK